LCSQTYQENEAVLCAKAMSTAMGVMIKILIIKVLKRETIPLSCGMKHANNVCMYIIMVELSEDEKVSIQKTEVIDLSHF